MAVIGNGSYYSPRGMEEVQVKDLTALAPRILAREVPLASGDSLVVDHMAPPDADAVSRAQKLKSWASRLEGAHRKLDALTHGLVQGIWVAAVAGGFGVAPAALSLVLTGACLGSILSSDLTERAAKSMAKKAEALASDRLLDSVRVTAGAAQGNAGQREVRVEPIDNGLALASGRLNIKDPNCIEYRANGHEGASAPTLPGMVRAVAAGGAPVGGVIGFTRYCKPAPEDLGRAGQLRARASRLTRVGECLESTGKILVGLGLFGVAACIAYSVFPPGGLALAAGAMIANDVARHAVKSEAEANRAEAERLSATVQVGSGYVTVSQQEGPGGWPSDYTPQLPAGFT